MKTQKNLILILTISAFIVFLNGCTKNKEFFQDTPNQSLKNKELIQNQTNAASDENQISERDVTKTSFKPPVEQTVPSSINRMIIKMGTMNIEIENYNEAEKKISEAANKFSGYVTNTSSNLNANGKRQGSLSVRVPSDKFDSFITEISLLGKVMSQNISGKDVTEEYIDLEARQKTQRELEKRLLELLTEKTAKLVDVVEVEQKLAGVRENIERTEGRMRFLRDQAAFSTLTISLFEPSLLQTSSGGGFFYEISEGFKRGLNGFTEVLSWLIAFVIAFSPVLVFLVLVYFIIKKIIKNRKFHKKNIQVQS